MTIRRAELSDAAAMAEIWNEVIRSSSSTFTTKEKSLKDIEILVEARPCLVIDEAGVTGFASYGPFRSGPGYAHVAEHTIYLAPTVQGAGNGRALLSALIEIARENGLRALIAGIGGENSGAVAFHQKLGFEKVGHLPQIGWKFGRWHDLLLMQKNLHQPD